MITSRTVRFKFKDQAEKTYTISIDNPKEDLKKADIAAFATYVADHDIFRPFGNITVGLVDAELVTVSRTSIE